MQAFATAREAKEYLIAQIVMEAERAGVPLSDTERKMMYFTETGWTLPDIWAVNEVFERDYDPSEYEAKIRGIARNARAYVHRMARSDLDMWKQAVQTLRREDHYLLVLLEEPKATSSSPTADRVKLVAAALVITLASLVIMYFFAAR